MCVATGCFSWVGSYRVADPERSGCAAVDYAGVVWGGRAITIERLLPSLSVA